MDRITRFRDLVARFPKNETPRFSLAQALSEAGRDDEAVTELEALVALKADYCVAWLLLGRCLLKLDRGAEARRALDETIRIAVAQGHAEPQQQARLLLDRLDEA
jgi:predicted Zn-dependent protease